MSLLTPSRLSDALGASWSSPLTPLTEARGYLVMACSTEQLHRTKRQMANVLSQAAATNRTFVEPGVASSFVVEPWGAHVSTCGTRAAGGARLYWDMPRLQEAALGLGTGVVGLDALEARLAELLGSGVPPPGFDRILDVLPCRTDIGVCNTDGGNRAVVDRSVNAYRESLATHLRERHRGAYIVLLTQFNQDPRADSAADGWFRPAPVLRAAAAEAACAFGLDPCACEGARCAAGGFVAVHWRSETALAFDVAGGLETCAGLLVAAAEAAATSLSAELRAQRGARGGARGGARREWSGSVAVDAAGRVALPKEGTAAAAAADDDDEEEEEEEERATAAYDGDALDDDALTPPRRRAAAPPLFLLSDLLNGTSATFPKGVAAARRRAARALERRFDGAQPRPVRLASLRAYLRAVGTDVDPGVRAQLELALAARAGRLVADVRPYGSQATFSPAPPRPPPPRLLRRQPQPPTLATSSGFHPEASNVWLPGRQVPPCPPAAAALAPCACTAKAGSAFTSALGEYFLDARAAATAGAVSEAAAGTGAASAAPPAGPASALTADGLISWLRSVPLEGGAAAAAAASAEAATAAKDAFMKMKN